jgi:transcription termination factor NusB
MNNENTLESVLQNLNNPEMSDNIKNLLDSISSSDNSSNSQNDIFSNLFSSVGNSNLDLLVALKPYLNEKRQKKLDQCENFISIIKTFEILNAFNQKD